MTIPLPQPGPKYDANNEAQTRSAITRFFSKVFNRDSDKDLAALEDLDGTGILARTNGESYSLRTITAGAGISIADGDGVGGNPEISLTNYEVGTWTPTIFGTTSAGTASYTFQNGIYVRIGDLCVLTFRVAWSGGTGTGTLGIAGMPFAFNGFPGVTLGFMTLLTAAAPVTAYGQNGTTQIRFYQNVSGAGVDLPYDSAADIGGSVAYIVSPP